MFNVLTFKVLTLVVINCPENVDFKATIHRKRERERETDGESNYREGRHGDWRKLKCGSCTNRAGRERERKITGQRKEAKR